VTGSQRGPYLGVVLCKRLRLIGLNDHVRNTPRLWREARVDGSQRLPTLYNVIERLGIVRLGILAAEGIPKL
jgi:hypothetical protein